MFEHRSLRWPITLGVVMFVVLAALVVGWVLLTVFGLGVDPKRAGLYIALLSIGATFLIFAIVGTALYLTLSIKAINLNRRQSNFIDSVTHELKSPIASLKLYLQTLSRRQLTPSEQEVFFKDMLEDVERLDQLFNHLLDVARLERDRAKSVPEDVRLDEVIRNFAKAVCEWYHRPSETIKLDLTPAVATAARVDLELVFRNIIDNAVKYADDENPQVEVVLRPEGTGRVVVRVTDNGRGIPQSLRHLIFGRFVRLGSELEREKPGTGLGLYIVRTMIGRLGGKIRIRERDRGSGAAFEVQLPARVMTPVGESSEAACSAAFDLARLGRSCLVASIDYHESIGSTSDRALVLAAADEARLPLLVLAQRQTAGRGRGTNRWWSDTGALTFSLVFEAPAALLPLENWPQVALVTGLAVCEALHSLAPGGHFTVKWPNDVYLGGRKVCGILSESVPGWRDRLIVGIGINVNNRMHSPTSNVQSPKSGQPADLVPWILDFGLSAATSLLDHDGLPRDLTDVLTAVLDHFDHRWRSLLDGSFAPLAAAYRQRCFLTGKTVTVEQPGGQSLVGLCTGIDDFGALCMRSEHGEQRVVSGSVVQWDGAA